MPGKLMEIALLRDKSIREGYLRKKIGIARHKIAALGAGRANINARRFARTV